MPRTSEARVIQPEDFEPAAPPKKRGRRGTLEIVTTPAPPVAEAVDTTVDWVRGRAKRSAEGDPADWIVAEHARHTSESAMAEARGKQMARARKADEARIAEVKQSLAVRDEFYKKAEAKKPEDTTGVLQKLLEEMKNLNRHRFELEAQLDKESATGALASLRRLFRGAADKGEALKLEIAKIDEAVVVLGNKIDATLKRLPTDKGGQILEGIKPLAVRDEVEIEDWFVDKEAQFIEKADHGEIRGGGWNPDGGSFLFYEDGLKITLDKDNNVMFAFPDGESIARTVRDLSAREISILMDHKRRYEGSIAGTRSILEGTAMSESDQAKIEQWFIDPEAVYDAEVYAAYDVTPKMKAALKDNDVGILPPAERKSIKQIVAENIAKVGQLETSREVVKQEMREKFENVVGFKVEELEDKKSAWGRLALLARLGKLRTEFLQYERLYNNLSGQIDSAEEEVFQDELWLKDPHKAAMRGARRLVSLLSRRSRSFSPEKPSALSS